MFTLPFTRNQPAYRVIEQRGDVALVVIRTALRTRYVIMRKVLFPATHALYNPAIDDDAVLYNARPIFDAVHVGRDETAVRTEFERLSALEPLY